MNEDAVRDFHLSEKFMIVLTVGVVENNTIHLSEVFKILWENNLINANVLIQNQSQFWTLYTFIPYQTGCSILTAIRLESFTPLNYTDNITVPEDQLFPDKLSDFNQCSLTIAASYQDPFVIHDYSEVNTELDGIDIEIIKQISKSLNFNAVYTNLSDGNHGAVFYSNETITGNLKLVCISYKQFLFSLYVFAYLFIIF